MNFKYIVAVSILIASAYARSEENDIQSLSQRDVLEEESLREIRGIGAAILSAGKSALKGLAKGLAEHFGKRTAEDHEVMKRLEAAIHSLSQRDVLEEESLREIRGIGAAILSAGKSALKGLAKGLAEHFGKRTAEEHEMMKRLEAVMRDLDSLDYPEEASEMETRSFNQEEIANLYTKKEKRILGPILGLVSNALGGLLG
uniref:Bombinin-like peptides 3 n=1 Tax=Bombina orientalis TaxID=8346 RepID=BMNL3_BOMOR|nr:RecName: Full=Bombinin-like peptides 3; Contains: RecName: Full=Acidic peptide 1; Contains: RecName: Full=Bombinin-like peptide 3; Short=BLP-3; Contains: RecName: Full=Octapeptide 1; Contains: RecName: Full=Acidic peptide 2; Contains: RecName: Full=Octapeptide 2; Contains: RecName: Full=Acidic peptide 3; Contains: RecName: Full=GH-1 peptide; Flags: Precursor [Bombina orientalis]AAA73095.1 bombinin-like peptide 3 [Bombina orientalis]